MLNVNKYIRETIDQFDVLSPEQQKELIKQARESEEARDIIILSNMKLIVYLASKYKCGIDINDLIHEGIIGLIKAIDNFDIEKNCCFSTFASMCINNAIRHAIYDKSTTVRIPLWVYQKGDVKSRKIIYKTKNTVPYNLISFKTIAKDGNGVEKKRIVESLLKCLNKKETRVMLSLFWEDKNLSEIGRELNLSRERIRQIKEKALKKIRCSYNTKRTINDLKGDQLC